MHKFLVNIILCSQSLKVIEFKKISIENKERTSQERLLCGNVPA